MTTKKQQSTHVEKPKPIEVKAEKAEPVVSGPNWAAIVKQHGGEATVLKAQDGTAIVLCRDGSQVVTDVKFADWLKR